MNTVKEDFLGNRLVLLLNQIPHQHKALMGQDDAAANNRAFCRPHPHRIGQNGFYQCTHAAGTITKTTRLYPEQKAIQGKYNKPFAARSPGSGEKCICKTSLERHKGEPDFFFAIFKKNNLQVTRNLFPAT